MNKQKLYNLVAKHKELRELLERIECVTFYQGSQITGMPRGGETSDKVATMACNLAEYGNQLVGLMDDIEKLSEDVDAIICEIIWLRVVDRLTWGDTGKAVGKNEMTVKQMYYRY